MNQSARGKGTTARRRFVRIAWETQPAIDEARSGTYDFRLLNAIEYVANSAPYLGNASFRNDLIIDNELRTSTALTCFFLDGEVTELEPGFNLLRDEHAWKRVPNTVFFNAIRMAWNNFSRRATYGQSGTSSASSEQRNADVVWLEGWCPHAHLFPQDRLRMTFLHLEVLDIRARARQLDHWIENCSMHKEPSWLALGRYLKRIWQRELEGKRALKQSRPTVVCKWQPPGPELHEGNRVRCKEGPICFALDFISQWHKEYRFVVGFLEEMEATVAFSPLENWGSDIFDASKPLGFNLAQHQPSRDQTSTASAAPRGSSEGTSSSQRPRAQRKQAAGHADPFCREDRPPANDNPYAPRAAHPEAGILGCDGCGREGHTAEQCYFKRHPNWNSQHATVKRKESAIAKEIRKLANGLLRSLPRMAYSGCPKTDSGSEDKS
jgi:hypothetical protein